MSETNIFEKTRKALDEGEAAAASLAKDLPVEVRKRIELELFSKIIISIANSCKRFNRAARRSRRKHGAG